jgi:hypothetical protein
MSGTAGFALAAMKRKVAALEAKLQAELEGAAAEREAWRLERTRLEGELAELKGAAVGEIHALLRSTRLEVERLRAELATHKVWSAGDDKWSAAVDAAFPTRSGAHDLYAIALEMVSKRRAKGDLVALVTWLLVRLRAAGVEP